MATTTPQTGHVGLNVTDLARSKAFYSDVLQLEVVRESTDSGKEFAFLGKDGNLLLTLWKQSAGTFPKQLPGLHHLSFQVENIEQVREAEARLRKRNARIHHGGIVPHSEGATSGGVFFEDPDGIRLEIFAPGATGENPAPYSGAPTCGFY
jgi:lactoylglutathione lyase